MTSIEHGPSWVERLNPRHWTLVWKLVIVGLVPALLALTLGALQIADQAGSAADLGRGGRLLDLHSQIAAAGDALRQERDQATLYVAGGRTGDRGQLTAANSHSDELLAAMRGGLQSAGTLDQATSVAVAQANGVLGQLTGLRRDVTDNGPVALPTIRDRYSHAIEGVDVLDRAVLRDVRVPNTAGQIDALTALQNVEAQLAVQHTVLGNAIRAGRLQDGDANAAGNADVQIFAQYRAYQVALTPDQLQRYGSFLDDPSNADRQRLAIAILTSAGKPNLGGVTAADWDSAYNNAKAVADRSAGLIRQDLAAASTAAAQRASNLAGINSVVLMLGLLIGITIAVLVARSLVRSLRVLRSAALDVAERRLPQAVESMRAGETPDVVVDPVPIRTRDEVGQVARAFDAVHGQAIRLAADQAALQTNVSAMFVNLSRRSQALVERQLQLIEALESNEQDADQLSNLFQLDHLATRMRRNSENLLVLAGTDLAKRNMAPVPMVDVLRAAVSEVEQYQRVVVQAPPAASIAGRAGSDLVHLLAELLDNATNFSPPESQVIMSATRTADGTMVVEISDRGVGMADHELSDANQRLGGPSTVDVSASRRMGLFVVGRLAARHGIGVRLTSAAAGPGTGLTASVTVPVSLIPTGVPTETVRPIGVPMAAGAPAQGRPGGDARSQRADVNGRPPSSLSALVAGTDGPTAGAPSGSGDDTTIGGGQGTTFTGRPPVNGAATHGLPTRKPGSSLRPEGPPPTDAPPGGFFDDAAGAEGSSDPAEQARLDQEAAARRDRLAGTPGLAPLPPRAGPQTKPGPDDERSIVGDERPTTDSNRPRLTKDLTDQGSPPTTERPFGATRPTTDPGDHVEGTRPIGPQAFSAGTGPGGPAGGEGLPSPGTPSGTPAGGRPSGPGGPRPSPTPGQQVGGPLPRRAQQPGEPRRPFPPSRTPTEADAQPTAAGANGPSSDASGPTAFPSTGEDVAIGAGGLPFTLGTERLQPAGPPSDPAGQEGGEPSAGMQRGPEPQRTGSSQPGQFRTDQQRRAPQPSGPQPSGPQSLAGRPTSDLGTGSRPDDDQPYEIQTSGAQTSGAQTSGAQTSAGQSYDAEQVDTPPSGLRPYGSSSYSTQPPGTQPPGSQPSGAQPYGTPSSGASLYGPYDFAPQQGSPRPNGSVSGTGGFPATPPRSGPVAMPPAPARPSSADERGLRPGLAPRPAMAPPPADHAADELFAPRVPSLDPEGQLPGRDSDASPFDLGETTPIFEEIASAWFRSNRPVPVSWESDTGPHPTTRAEPATTSPPAEPREDTDPTGITKQIEQDGGLTEEREPVEGLTEQRQPVEGLTEQRQPVDGLTEQDRPVNGPAEGRPAVGTPADSWPPEGRPAPGPADIPGDAGADAPPSFMPSPRVPSARPTLEDPFDEPLVSQQSPESEGDFSTAADEGWLAASGAATDRPDELTAAGLPKRRPRARLIPGSAGSAVMAPAASSPRSAETIRGRLASYQQGVRQGRETRLRSFGETPATPAAADADHDEESS